MTVVVRIILALLTLTAITVAQERLTLRQAVDLALRSNQLLAAAEAVEQEADARIYEARSGYLPRAQLSESFERSNDPVFVFTSLLAQHQITDANVASGALNRSAPLNNYRSRLSVEQMLFDAGQRSHRLKAARIARQLAGEDTRRSQSDVILLVVQNYFGVELAEENLKVARESVESARADLARAQAIYDSGRSTLADVLAVRVHLAAMREQEIRASNDVAVARPALNDVLGVSLDHPFELRTPLAPAPAAIGVSLEEYRRIADQNRAELRQAEATKQLAHTQKQIASSAYWPEVVGQAILEADRQEFSSKGRGYWLAGVAVRWSLWNGGETKARVQQARSAESRAEAMAKRFDSAIGLEVRKAYLDVQAAAQRVEVAAAACSEAEEAHRIVQNRHQSGLTTVTELLRSETALAAARTRYLTAVYDQRVATATLEHAAGILVADSALVN